MRSANDEQFRKDLEEIFSQVQLVPDDTIKSIVASGYAEDGRTFTLMLDTTDGGTVIVSACPGQPLKVSLAIAGDGGEAECLAR